MNINPIVTEILEKRGVITEEDILEFLSDKPKKTYDPFLLHGLEAGVDLILSAVYEKKKICIYGDYDADGITSTSILMQFLKNLDADIFYYIPSRFSEGYGLNNNALDKIKESGAELVVTVDCGSVSVGEVAHAKEIGMEIVVTDHHSMGEPVPDCIVINPKHPKSQYPFRDLAGCGVAFKLCQGIQRKANLPKRTVNELLDLVAVGTIGDIVPLIDENRTLVKYGMRVLKEGVRQGLNKLVEDISIKREILTSESVAFGIVPHLNAAGRMKSAKTGVMLMNSGETEETKALVEELINNNKLRKKVQEDTYDKCIEIIEKNHINDLFLIVLCPEAHEGIAGIVAGKIKDAYNRPTVVITQSEDGFLKGTGRSIVTVDLHKILKTQERLFKRFGGHVGACGFLMAEENLQELREGLRNEMEFLMAENPYLFEKQYEADVYAEGQDITEKLISELELLAPFGNKNERPLIEIYADKLQNIAFMGKKQEHGRFDAVCQDGTVLNCVAFNRGETIKNFEDKEEFVITGYPEISEWNGNRKIQFIISDIVNMGGI